MATHIALTHEGGNDKLNILNANIPTTVCIHILIYAVKMQTGII